MGERGGKEGRVMEAEGINSFMQFVYGMNDRMLFWIMIALLFVLALVLLMVLVSELSRLRFMEYNERLARNIWEDKGEEREIAWPLEERKGFPKASCGLEDCGAAGSGN